MTTEDNTLTTLPQWQACINGQVLDSQGLIRLFQSAAGWEDRYRYLLKLGNSLPPLSKEQKCPDNQVHGCESQVWMIDNLRLVKPTQITDKETGQITPGQSQSAQTVQLICDSDARIIKGLLAALLLAIKDKAPAEILEFDEQAYLQALQLGKHLSPSRSNGLHSVIKQLKQRLQAAQA
jgi:cysteine desulfuration protein SufE